MIIPMNNTVGNSSRDRAQHLYNKNVELETKRRKAAQAKIPSDPNAWQQMRENYESILLEDHTFSEQHDIEYALWQLHYKRIEELRAHYNAAQGQNGKGPVRPGPTRIIKIRSQFKTFLSEATGFYHDLMVKIRVKYGLSLGYISDDPQNENKSGLISCHRCFIYLGDLARYKGLYGEGDSKTRDFDTASSYYKQAATLWPSSGNPHHQLAILASYSGDELLAVYRYFRSLAVDTPFTTARDNLIIAFEKNRQSYCQLLGDSKASPTKKPPARVAGKGRNKGETWVSLKDRKTEPNLVVEREPTVFETLKNFSIRFVRLNGILFTRTSLETFMEVFSVTRGDLCHLLSSGHDEVFNFGSESGECKLFITRFIAIMIFTVYNVNKETEHQSYAEILQRSVVLQNAFTAIFDFMALILERCIQLNNPFSSFLLPGIMIFVEWLACFQNHSVTNEMEEKQATARLSFWNNFVSFLNKILSEVGDETCFSKNETGNRFALFEDMELRGFLPLLPVQVILDFSRTNYSDGNKEKNARLHRIVAAGKALTTGTRLGQQGIYFDLKRKRFFFGVEPQNVVEQQNHLGSSLQPKLPPPHGEGEDEDEVIVFKPSVPEKHSTDESSPPVTISHSGFPLPPPPGSSENTQYLPFGQPEVNENGFSNLNLLGKGFPTPSSESVGFGGYNERMFEDPEIIIPSKFDLVIMTSAPIPSKTKSVKSPVSRPIRHFGPPPGFNTFSSKFTDVPLIRNETQRMDDYSWLDGYQLPYGNSVSCLPQPNKLLMNAGKTSLGMESFPFPGKQVSTNSNGWGGYQVAQHSNVYQEEMRQIRNGNEEFIGVPQQYQGESLWEGGFFV